MTHPTGNLSPGQYRARLKICRQAAEDGLNLTKAAKLCSISTNGLMKWLRQYDADTHEKLASLGKSQRNPFGEDKTESRLALVVALGQSGAAIAAGVTQQAMSQWLIRHGFDDPKGALAELRAR